jgi:hypothetical protein
MTEAKTSIVEQLESAKAAIAEKLETKGYVVAGYGGDTYYAYVGEGKGYQGAVLTPVSSHPVVFDTVQTAKREAHNGTYKNGRGDVIKLEVVEASKYFAKIYADLEKNIELVKELAR